MLQGRRRMPRSFLGTSMDAFAHAHAHNRTQKPPRPRAPLWWARRI